jgi:hypothetical protein
VSCCVCVCVCVCVPAVDSGVTNPQTSFDTGHCLLGSSFSHLEDYLEAGRSSPLFCFTAHHFLRDGGFDSLKPAQWAAHRSPGYLTNGFIELAGDCPSMNLANVASCVGDCGVVLPAPAAKYPAAHLWQAAGGVALPLNLLWEYCGRAALLPEKHGHGHGEEAALLKTCILSTLELLSCLVAGSMDMRDAILQEHGFHVVALALGRLPLAAQPFFLDAEMADGCLRLVRALRDDAAGGDGIAAALQGLLMDFSLWGGASLGVRVHLLGCVCDLPSIGAALHKAVGTQRVLDVLRLHVLEDASCAADAAATAVSDRLLGLAVEAARAAHIQKQHKLAQRSANNSGGGGSAAGGGSGNNLDAGAGASAPASVSLAFAEAEMLLRGMEDARSNDTVELILRCLAQLRGEAPDELEGALESTRFNDTTAVYLLCRRGFSAEVRRSVLLTALWSVRRAHSVLLDDILELCDYMFRKGGAASEQGRGPAQGGQQGGQQQGSMGGGPGPGGPAQNRRGSVKAIRSAFTDGKKVKELLEGLRTKKIVLQRLWRIVCMLSECLRRALRDGAWAAGGAAGEAEGKEAAAAFAFESFRIYATADDLVKLKVPVPGAPGSSGDSGGEEARSTVRDVVDLLRHDGPLGQLDAWLVLPLLAAMLPYLETQHAERLLAALGVALKTSEPQVLAFCVLADNIWVKYFVDIALVGQVAATAASLQSGSESSPSKPPSPAPVVAGSDLALDAYVQVLTYQLLHFGNSAWLSWKAFHSHLKRDISTCVGANEISILRKCAGFLIQKLTKHQQDFTEDVMSCLSKIVVFVEEKRLCGNELVMVGGGLASHAYSLPAGRGAASADLLGMGDMGGDHPPPKPALSLLRDDELHLVEQICHFLSSLRVLSQSLPLGRATPFGFSEVRVMQPCVRILLGCLPHVDLEGADSLCLELRSVILHSADRWMFYDPEYYKLFIVDIFGGLQSAIRKPGLPADVAERYRTAVLTIAHIFLELRRVSLEQSGFISPHVVPTLDAVGITEGYYESDVVLSLLQKYLETARDSVDGGVLQAGAGDDFGEDEYDMMGPSSGSPLPRGSLGGGGARGGQHEDIISFDTLTDPAPSADLLDFLDSHPESAEATDMSLSPPAQSAGVELLLDFGEPLAAPSGDSEQPAELFPPAPPREQQPQLSPEAAVLSDQELYFRDWLQRRQGIIAERIDSSNARLDRVQQAALLTGEASRKCWLRLRRKVQSESFLEDHWCSWKLGISHEGHFPGRRRVILRPRFMEGEDADKEYKKSRPYVCGEGEHAHRDRDLVTSDDDDSGVPVGPDSPLADASSPAPHASLKRVPSFANSADFGDDEQMMTLLEMAKSGIIADPIATTPQRDPGDGEGDRGSGASSPLAVSPRLDSSSGKATAAAATETKTESPSGLLVGWGKKKAAAPAAGAGSSIEQSWGIVDADDEDGGYGVVGYVSAGGGDRPGGRDSPTGLAEGAPGGAPRGQAKEDLGKAGFEKDHERMGGEVPNEVAGDMQFDILQLDADVRQGRAVNTGASLPGTRRVTSGHSSSVIVEAAVTLITASGNYIGSISFTASEIYFTSSNIDSEEGGHLLDAAAVTLMPNRRIRRRKWVVERISGRVECYAMYYYCSACENNCDV